VNLLSEIWKTSLPIILTFVREEVASPTGCVTGAGVGAGVGKEGDTINASMKPYACRRRVVMATSSQRTPAARNDPVVNTMKNVTISKTEMPMGKARELVLVLVLGLSVSFLAAAAAGGAAVVELDIFAYSLIR
jgi:hypothetical protein